jgi:hypothetical protein
VRAECTLTLSGTEPLIVNDGNEGNYQDDLETLQKGRNSNAIHNAITSTQQYLSLIKRAVITYAAKRCAIICRNEAGDI